MPTGIASKNDLGRPVNVGEMSLVVLQTTDSAQVYDQNGEKSGNPITDQAALNAVRPGRSVGIYGPITVRAPKDGSPWVAKAEAAYHATSDRIVAEMDLPPEPPDDQEPPF